MFIYNLKVNRTGILKTIIICFSIIVLGLIAIVILSLIKNANVEKNYIDDQIPSSEVATLTPENYTNILKAVHNDLNTYIGQKISFTGYVYRVNGMEENQFVLARDMDIGNHQTVVVGFLCCSEKAKEFETYAWITISGEITKGNFKNTEMPIIHVTSIEKANQPENNTVPMPDDSFVPTAVIY